MVTTKSFGQQLIFKFLTKPKQQDFNQLKTYSISQSLNTLSQKMKQLKFLKDEINYKRINEQIND